MTVVCDLEGKSQFPETRPLYAGLVGLGSDGSAEQAISTADFVLTVGVRLDPTTAQSCNLLRNIPAQLVHADHSAARLARDHARRTIPQRRLTCCL